MVTSAQLRAARGLLDWTVRELAERANVHRNTVHRAEHQDEGHGFAVEQVVQTLEAAGCVFVAENEGVGVMLRKAPKQ